MVQFIRPNQSKNTALKITLYMIVTMFALAAIGIATHQSTTSDRSGVVGKTQPVAQISHEGGAADKRNLVVTVPNSERESEGLSVIVDGLFPVGEASADDECDGVNPQPNPDCADPTATPTSTPTATPTPGND